MREHYSFGEVIYMGDIQGPEKVNSACGYVGWRFHCIKNHHLSLHCTMWDGDVWLVAWQATDRISHM